MLEVSQLRASYRGIEALRGINLRVAEGEMIAIIGANGAGKSTLLNCLSGVVRASGGHILFDGSDITQRPPHLVSRAGLLQVPEGRQVLAEMSVHENLLLGLLARGPRAARYDLERVLVLFPILRERLQQLAGTLSGGQQQMLAIGRALMGSPRVLLLEDGIGIWSHVLRGLNKEAKLKGERNDKDINEKFGVSEIPAMILIDKNGMIIGKYTSTDDVVNLDKKLSEIFE